MVSIFAGRHGSWVPALLLAGLCLLAFANAVPNGLVLDDQRAVAKNPCVVGPQSGPACAFERDFWGRPPRQVGRSYRPLTTLSFAADWTLGGGAPWALHLASVLWHLLASLLVYWLILRLEPRSVCLTERRIVAFSGAAVFAVLAVHTEAVAGVVGRADLLAAVFGLGALALWCPQAARESAGPRAVARAGGALLLTAAALLSHELGVLMALALVFCGYAQGAAWRRQLLAAVAVACLLGGYLLWRRLLLGQLSGPPPDILNNPAVALAGLDRLWLGLSLVERSIRLLVAPLGLSAEYGLGAIVAPAALSWSVLIGAAVCGLLVLGLLARKLSPLIALGSGVLLTGLLLLSNTLLLLPTAFGERLLYLPSVGFCLLVAGGAELLLQRERRWLLAGLLVPFFALQLAVTVQRNPDWRDNLSLFASAVQSQPKSVRAQLNYGLALAERGRWREAITPLSRAFRKRADLTAAGVHLAIAYDLTQQTDRAAKLFAQLFAQQPQDPLLAQDYERFLRRHGLAARAAAIAEAHRRAASRRAKSQPAKPQNGSVAP